MEEVSNSNYTYATFQETSGEEAESWLTFIRYQGNEEALQHLHEQLSQFDWYILDDLSTFDLEMKYFVSEKTAHEMTKIDMNHHSFHRKFDGKMKKINLGFKSKYSDEKKMVKAFGILGYGKIADYLDDEDVHPDELEDVYSSEDSDDSGDDSSESEESSKSSAEEPAKKPKGKLPSALTKCDAPKWAKAKMKRK
jgi:hypothetical protein